MFRSETLSGIQMAHGFRKGKHPSATSITGLYLTHDVNLGSRPVGRALLFPCLAWQWLEKKSEIDKTFAETTEIDKSLALRNVQRHLWSVTALLSRTSRTIKIEMTRHVNFPICSRLFGLFDFVLV